MGRIRAPSRGGHLELEGGVMCSIYMEHLFGLASECRC